MKTKEYCDEKLIPVQSQVKLFLFNSYGFVWNCLARKFLKFFYWFAFFVKGRYIWKLSLKIEVSPYPPITL